MSSNTNEDEVSYRSIKMVLGDMGLEILKVLRLGPMDLKSIKFLSGIPMACVKGRIPVLMSLNMIKKSGSYYSLEIEGLNFLKYLDAEDR